MRCKAGACGRSWLAKLERLAQKFYYHYYEYPNRIMSARIMAW